jgi:hypothetical protein
VNFIAFIIKGTGGTAGGKVAINPETVEAVKETNQGAEIFLRGGTKIDVMLKYDQVLDKLLIKAT